MPYRIRKDGAGYIIQKQRAGKWMIKSHHTTLTKARAALHVLEGVKHAWKPRKE